MPKAKDRFFKTIPPAVRHCAILSTTPQVHQVNGREQIVHREMGSVDIHTHPTRVSHDVAEELRHTKFYGERFIEVDPGGAILERAFVEKKSQGVLEFPEVGENEHEKAKTLLSAFNVNEEEWQDVRGRFNKSKLLAVAKQKGITLPNY